MLGFPSAEGHSEGSGWDRRRIGPVYGASGMVASAHPLVTSAGIDVLRDGGNAVDAAVAAAVVASVVMPEMCGLGGDLFAIVHDPASARTLSFLGSGIAPRSATIGQMRAAGEDGRMPYHGLLAVGVPGMVDGYFAMLGRFGSMPFARLAEQAVDYAERGHPLTADCAAAIDENRGLLASFPSSAAVFLPGGDPPRAGGILRQPDLARTLRTVAAEGADAFYRGSIARRIAAWMAGNGGAMTAEDLAGHRTDVGQPISTTYRDHVVHQTGLPTQGMILLESLNIVEQANPGIARVDSADWTHLLVEAKKLAYADRLGFAADPAFAAEPSGFLLSKAWAGRRAALIDMARSAEGVPAGAHEAGDTTHLCVVDGDGMMVSLIQSVSSAFGCGVVAGDTGIVLNNRVGRGFSLDEGHPNIFAPGKKTMHTLNCFLIADASGTPVLVGGTPGGDGQPQWNLQMISALIDGGRDVQAAIETPRWTSWPGTDPLSLPNRCELRTEDRCGEPTMADLAARGHRVVRQGAWAGGGAAQLIARDPATGVLAGGSDPRVEGMAAGF
ncbi:MAG: gamma-glutamyltransferase [Thermomicrobiales bacterium]